MKSRKEIYFNNAVKVFLILNLIFITKEVNLSNGLKVDEMEKSLQSYMRNPPQFIATHDNKENFMTVLSNFTRMNGEMLYHEYIDNKNQKDLQYVLDNINDIKMKNVYTWDYDYIQGKFNLPDEMRNYPDFYKWQLIISIMKTMKKFPVLRKNSDKNLRSETGFEFPYETKIIDPPI